jgi:UDP-N-acetylmuramoyl-L-alanyl-D-glutamate--2,6-diaminopimelate ligase
MVHALSRLVGNDGSLPKEAAATRIAGITSDSRKVGPGFLFVAIPGGTTDGATFISDARARGAVAVAGLPGLIKGNGHFVDTDNPRLFLARAAARFYVQQPSTIVAVTGTNGKTSVSVFVRQIWESMGFRSASIGTIGVISPEGVEEGTHTTPDPSQLHEVLSRLTDNHVDHLAIEASSHGLVQYRLHGLQITSAGFTNLTQDHLDYHASMEDYFLAKMKLFEEILPPGATAVINMDGAYGESARDRCLASGRRVFTVGRAGENVKLISVVREGLGQELVIETASGRHNVNLPLAGEFQVSNALVAAGLVIAAGGEERLALHALESLKGAPGRLDLAGRSASGAPIFVDYAHTPDALENVLSTLRPLVRNKLALVFGCGGDRDAGKRPVMGKIAVALADRVYVTDDNPRGEDAAKIRAQILATASGAVEVESRAQAILRAVTELEQGDVLLVAGKGHEQGQIIGGEKRPFSDHKAVHSALRGELYRG